MSWESDDCDCAEEGEAYGRNHATEFVADHSVDMVNLIATYGDGDAAELLDHLREMFWAELWKPRVGR